MSDGPAPELSLDAILAAAGVDVDTTAPWLNALGMLVESARTEGGLSAMGAAGFASRLTQFVAERRRGEAILARHPEVTARPLQVRFAVAGMGRSGTTLLQRLLSCDPAVSFLPTWQAMRPIPPMGTGNSVDDRRDAVVAQIAELARMNPESMRIHPLDADAPEEEVFLLQHSFASMLFSLNCPLPAYNSWLASTDHEDAYRLAFDLLRLNEWMAGTPERPRIMKSPQFLLDLRVVARLTPGAIIAQTHRDPVDLVGSYCSTYANSRRRSMTDFDPADLGRERLEFLGLMADRAVDVRGETPEPDRYVDVHYATLIADPFAVIQQLYAAAGVELTETVRRQMQLWLDAHPQHQAGRHTYALADYGLDRATVEARFGPYLERFQVVRDED